jgi:histone-lysine N-methyltransferase SETMAR
LEFLGVLIAHFQKRGENVNSASYCAVESLGCNSQKTCRPIGKGVLLHHDNARPHTDQATQNRIQEPQWELLEHPPYSLNLTPSDFRLFGPLKNHLGGKHFTDEEVVETEVQKWLRQQSKDFYVAGFDALVKRWDKCIDVGRGCVKK